MINWRKIFGWDSELTFLNPGETMDVHQEVIVPKGADLSQVMASFSFCCGVCGFEHKCRVNACAGGTIYIECQCGEKLKLFVKASLHRKGAE